VPNANKERDPDGDELHADEGVVTSPPAERHTGVNEPLVGVPAALPRVLPRGRLSAADVTRLVTDAYDAHQRELFGFAVAATRDPAVAEDLVQETFLRLVSEIRAGRQPERTRPWLFRVCANLATSRGRRIQVADRYAPRLASESIAESPEAAHLRIELGADLADALLAITADERVGILMSASGFTGREIAAALGRTEGATRTMLSRARVRIQARLEGSST
jgi:RNA polymerase sigma-70 factor (ECF subfamily)